MTQQATPTTATELRQELIAACKAARVVTNDAQRVWLEAHNAYVTALNAYAAKFASGDYAHRAFDKAANRFNRIKAGVGLYAVLLAAAAAYRQATEADSQAIEALRRYDLSHHIPWGFVEPEAQPEPAAPAAQPVEAETALTDTTPSDMPTRHAYRLYAALTAQASAADEAVTPTVALPGDFTVSLGWSETIEVFAPDGLRVLAFTPLAVVTYADPDPDQWRAARTAVFRWVSGQVAAERRAQRAEQEGKG